MPRTCKNHPDSFCYICGKYTPSKQKHTITSSVKHLYRAYFGIRIGDQDKPWAPHITCVNCFSGLCHWSKGNRKSMPFGIPMVWREPTIHLEDCYFCMVKPLGRNAKSSKHIKYPNIPSAMQPVPHSDDVHVPIPPKNVHRASSTDSSCSDGENPDVYQEIKLTGTSGKSPQLFEQSELDDLVRDLGLSKESAQLLGSRLAEKNLLASNTHFAWYRHREQEFVQYFTKSDDMVYCHDVSGLVEHMGKEYHPEEWRLFIDSSTRSLKAVLLFNGKQVASLPIAHSVTLKETYATMSLLLNNIQYQDHNWLLCGDLKVLTILLGMQGGHTKHPCFLCLWDSRADSVHYRQREWPQRTEFVPGRHNVKTLPLVPAEKVLLPPLHIKLGLIKFCEITSERC
ncbi:uncharacterized protein LOC143034074 [Oratosquilla oratoria]|uniref:uncharacterized protein LOC143034074 n=1 Tax=Oratosquilla oratoria TaxID=337810 RepID=UPI003F75E6E3